MADFDFNTARLTDYDNTKPLPEDVYTFMFSDVKAIEYEKKDGSGTGTRIQVRLTVVDHDSLSGRTAFQSFFPGSGMMKIFSKVSRELGIEQEDGESVVEWLTRVSNLAPPALLKIPVQVGPSDWRKDSEGNPEDENKFLWFDSVGV